MTTVVIGAKNTTQLEEIKSTQLRLSEDDLHRLNEAGKLSPEYPGWSIK
ncbi:hypothetical protein [Parachlamydia acanthamoebae]|nr:hypothetical protein [Parachlamydia acanthamoebae]EFB42165.1 hypothetical protein pah_c014o090 [Parachlamydia acanthamoebae str. Hall's coccus]